MDISENNVKNVALKYNVYGMEKEEGATETVASNYFLSWIGIVNTVDDEYDELGRVSAVIDSTDNYHIYDFVALPAYNISLIDDYKMFLIRYGALATSLHGADGGASGDYNETSYGAYFRRNGSAELPDHVVTLVGWNDTYSKDNFIDKPSGDGAWIIKNSWGSDWADNGYYYVSYYDDIFASINPYGAIGYIINNEHNYEKIYQYTFSGDIAFRNRTRDKNLTPEEESELLKKGLEVYVNYFYSLDYPTASYATIYESIDNDLIAAVGTYFDKSGVNYSITISVNDKIVHNQEGKSSWSGYETIKLTKYIPIKEGDIFKINITSDAVPISKSRLKVKEGMNIANINNSIWQAINDIDGNIAGIKVYTIPDNTSTENQSTINTTQKAQYEINKITPANNKLYIKTDKQKLIREKINKEKILYTIIHDGLKTYTKNVLTLNTIMQIFNQDFTNGHLLVYIDDKLVFNDTTTDNISQVILEIIDNLLGNHEIKIIFTNQENQTNTYTDNITIKKKRIFPSHLTFLKIYKCFVKKLQHI